MRQGDLDNARMLAIAIENAFLLIKIVTISGADSKIEARAGKNLLR